MLQKRARGRPRIRPPEEERKHRDLGSYNLFVMKAQNVAGPDVKNHRAFMGLIGTFWKVFILASVTCVCSSGPLWRQACWCACVAWVCRVTASQRSCGGQAMDQGTRESFIATYKGLLDQLNEKKKAGIKFDFGHELKMYERDHELDTISYFRVRPEHCSPSSRNNAILSAVITLHDRSRRRSSSLQRPRFGPCRASCSR